MTVYIEYVIIDNLTMTLIIACLAHRLIKLSVNKKRVCLSIIISTAASVIYPLLSVNFYVLSALKIALFIILSLIMFYGRKCLLKGAAAFLGMTIFMGGVLFGIGYAAYGDAHAALTLPAFDFPVGLVLCAALATYLIFKRLISIAIVHRSIKDYVFSFEASVFDKSINSVGFLDSGNLLMDDKNGLPIIVLSVKLTTNILSDEQLGLIMCGKGEKIGSGAHYIDYGTLSKSGKLLVVKADKFRLYLKDEPNIIKEVMLGLSFTKLRDEFDALLSPNIF